jgi:hypothetical protein
MNYITAFWIVTELVQISNLVRYAEWYFIFVT